MVRKAASCRRLPGGARFTCERVRLDRPRITSELRPPSGQFAFPWQPICFLPRNTVQGVLRLFAICTITDRSKFTSDGNLSQDAVHFCVRSDAHAAAPHPAIRLSKTIALSLAKTLIHILVDERSLYDRQRSERNSSSDSAAGVVRLTAKFTIASAHIFLNNKQVLQFPNTSSNVTIL